MLAALALPALLPALAEIVPDARRPAAQPPPRRGPDFASRSPVAARRSPSWPTRRGSWPTRSRARFRLFTRRHLLEWTTAAQAESAPRRDVRRFYGACAAPLVAVAGAVARRALAGRGACRSRPFLAALGALAGRSLGESAARPRRDAHHALARNRTAALVARRTWRFFETFVDRRATTACLPTTSRRIRSGRRPPTSPTNIGLYLLSMVAGARLRLARYRATRSSVSTRRWPRCERLERYRGHFYNWYDTGRFVRSSPVTCPPSTAATSPAHLLALGNACRRASTPRCWSGIGSDSGTRSALAEESARLLGDARRPDGAPCATRRDHRSLSTTLHELPAALDGVGRPPRLPPPSPTRRGRRARLMPSRGREPARSLSGAAAAADGEPRARRRAITTSGRGLGAPRAALAADRAAGPSPARRARPAGPLADAGRPPAAGGARDADGLERPRRDAWRVATLAARRSGGLARASGGARSTPAAARRAAPASSARWTSASSTMPERELFSIGYRVDGRGARRPLLRSARLGSAARQLHRHRQRRCRRTTHWFRLGRPLTPVGSGRRCSPGPARCSST